MYFWTSQNLNFQKACWSLFLSKFDFSLIYRPGQHSEKPDSLSCWADHQAEEEEENQDQVVLSPNKFHGSTELNEFSELSESLAANGVGPLRITLEGKETDFLDWVCNCTDWDDSVI